MFPYKVYSHYSLQSAIGTPAEIAKIAYSAKLPLICLTDYNSVSGYPELVDAVAKLNKGDHKMRTVAGCTVEYIDEEITLLAKNKEGWRSLCQIISNLRSSLPQPIITLLQNYNAGLLCISEKSPDQKLKEIFGTNYLVADYNLDRVASSYYTSDSRIRSLEVVVCSRLGTCLTNIKSWIAAQSEKDKYLLAGPKSLESILNSLPICKRSGHNKILTEIEDYTIYDKPALPKYHKSQKSSIETLRELCRAGWAKKIKNKIASQPKEVQDFYLKSIKEELDLMEKTGLSDYILLVYDLVNQCRNNGVSAGLRGSAAGCLMFHLLDVVLFDPLWPDPSLPFNQNRSLLFSRFINKGRFSEGRFSLPDADIDLPPDYRDSLKDYIRNTYGVANTANIGTFLQMKGKMAIKEVFRVFDLSPDTANDITKYIAEEAKVQDDLEDIRQEKPDYNIIDYSIDHIPKVASFAKEYPNEFAIARDLVKTLKSEGIHAAGMIISNSPVSLFCPTRYDPEHKCFISTMKMQDVEAVGLVKMDLLSVDAFSKIDQIVELINKRKVL